MNLLVGTKLGPYEIVAPIGKGGMGEVWKARDTRLGRDVALKILPAVFATDSDRMARFEREARVLASLDHPNIAAIYGLEESDGVRALVLALVDGPTLADRITAGPIPLDEAIQIARQIAEAVEYAHDRGVIHRDLKPANIKITTGGMVKVLDFGLAKALDDEPTGASTTTSPTVTMNATRAGVLLGTAHYMSPEQAKGKQADRRSDVWSFGAVLYEMVMGKQPFTGESVGEVIAAVIKDEPKLDVVSAEMRGLIGRCLIKDPRQRLQAIGEARIVLENPAPPVQIAAATAQRNRPWTWIIAGVLAVILGFVSYRHVREDPPRVIKVSVLPPEKAVFKANSLPAVSPDGRRIAFVATSNGKDMLWVRELNSLGARALTGTEGAIDPFWSPDSRKIAFFTNDKLKQIEVAGGPAGALCDLPATARGGSWNKNDVIVFGTSTSNGGIFRVSSAGTATPLTTVDRASGETSHRFPWFLPDGHHFLYTATANAEKTAVYVGDLDSKDRKLIVTAISNAVYTPPGTLLFVREHTLMAQPFDARRLQTMGDAVPIAEQVDTGSPTMSQNQFSASQNGVLAYTSGLAGGNLQLTWVDRSGKAMGTVGDRGLVAWPAISPDGETVAFYRADQEAFVYDIWLNDLVRGTATRFTFGPRNNTYPVWSPDGSRIAFESMRDGTGHEFQKAVAGTAQLEVLAAPLGDPPRATYVTDWSRDGRYIIEQLVNIGETRGDVWVLPLFGDRKPFPYLRTQFNEQYAKLSPNGQWLAYTSDESKREEIYVQTFPMPGGKWQVSTNGGSRSVWSRDGKELYFIGADGKMMAVEVKGSGTKFEAGVPKPLFDAHFPDLSGADGANTWFDVNKEGRFLIPAPVERSPTGAMTVVLNWNAELKR